MPKKTIVEVKSYNQLGKMMSHQVFDGHLLPNGALDCDITATIKAAIMHDHSVVIGRASSKVAGYSGLVNKLCPVALPDLLIKIYQKGGRSAMGLWQDITKGLAVVGVVTVKMPKILLDEKITVKEMADLTTDICGAIGWKTSITLPQDAKDTPLAIRIIDD
jgi:hypothetical protein